MLMLGSVGPYILDYSDFQSAFDDHYYQLVNSTQLHIESVAHQVHKSGGTGLRNFPSSIWTSSLIINRCAAKS